jgi:hypothetical protein
MAKATRSTHLRLTSWLISRKSKVLLSRCLRSKYLLTDAAGIADNAYFAQHAVFPGVNATLTAPGTPWILYGGSLAGAQTSFSLHEYGGDDGILWGGIGSSATIKAKLAYVEWYDPIQKFGPQDCVGSINALVDKIDHVFSTGNATAIRQMKAVFGLQDLTNDGDFAMTIAFPLGGPMNYPTNTCKLCMCCRSLCAHLVVWHEPYNRPHD